MLWLAKAEGYKITLGWGLSCLESDHDYEIYEGTLGDFTSHQSVQCSTGGATSATIMPSAGSSYFLVVPTNGLTEGSYGVDGDGNPRPTAIGGFACRAQMTSTCP